MVTWFRQFLSFLFFEDFLSVAVGGMDNSEYFSRTQIANILTNLFQATIRLAKLIQTRFFICVVFNSSKNTKKFTPITFTTHA